jgi:hypothetical protein
VQRNLNPVELVAPTTESVKRFIFCNSKLYNPGEVGLISEEHIASIFMIEDKLGKQQTRSK